MDPFGQPNSHAPGHPHSSLADSRKTEGLREMVQFPAQRGPFGLSVATHSPVSHRLVHLVPDSNRDTNMLPGPSDAPLSRSLLSKFGDPSLFQLGGKTLHPAGLPPGF